jgi:hypothetical protein
MSVDDESEAPIQRRNAGDVDLVRSEVSPLQGAVHLKGRTLQPAGVERRTQQWRSTVVGEDNIS